MKIDHDCLAFTSERFTDADCLNADLERDSGASSLFMSNWCGRQVSPDHALLVGMDLQDYTLHLAGDAIGHKPRLLSAGARQG